MPPLTPQRSASEMPASVYSSVGPDRAFGGNLPLLTYGFPYCRFTNDHYVAASLCPWWPYPPISSSPPFTIPPTPSHPTLTTPQMTYSTAPIEKDCIASPYASDSDSSPHFHDAADSELSPDFHDLDLSPDFRDLKPIHHTIPSTIIQYCYLHPPVRRVYAIYWSPVICTIIFEISHPTGKSITSINKLFHLHQTCPCYQTIHYYFRKCPTALCKSIYSIYQLQTDYAIYRSAVICTIISKYLF